MEILMPKLPRYVVLLAFLFCFPTLVFGKAIYAAEVQGIRIVLTDEKCELSVVSNLPLKATWYQGDKVFTGCWGLMGDTVMSYFEQDRSVAAIPTSVFKKLQDV
jgi:hypothetical protein